jgi:hypothetical protein
MSLDHLSLVTVARDLLERPDPTTAGLWPRAAALLTRQALEASLDQLWRARAPGVELASARAQLLCLPKYLGDPALAGRVSYAWTGLSRACHHHAYELPPSSSELANWVGIVEELSGRVGGLAGGGPKVE